MAKITFLADGAAIDIEAREGETIMQAARRAGIALDAPCGGDGACGKCRIQVASGTVGIQASRHISPEDAARGWALACQSRVAGDAAVRVPGDASAWRDALRTAGESQTTFEQTRAELEGAGLAFTSGVASYHLRMDAPTPSDTLPDAERAANALKAGGGFSEVTFALPALRALAQVLRANDFEARFIVESDGRRANVLDALPPSDAAPAAGLAVDLGTTSVAGLLVDLETGRTLARAAMGNGQIRYGADVISRIVEASRAGGGERLRAAVIEETLGPLVKALCAAAGLGPERVYRAAVAGNTTMNHLLLGLYADPVRLEPYVPSFLRINDLRADALGLGLHPEARLMLAPNVGSYVGGDITAGVLASMLWDRDALTLLIDLGTNGELVLGNRDFMLTCACSAGPAFEGGGLSCGMRATGGAIDALAIEPDTLIPRFTTVGGARPAGICGSGIIDVVAGLFTAKAVDGRGRFCRENSRIRADADGMKRYVIAEGAATRDGREIAVTEADIDSFIRAKGAIFSATMTMLGSVGMSPDMLDRVLVAGGIGSGIDMDSAVVVGMLPDIDRERFAYIGNSALRGAWAMLASAPCREKLDALAASMTYLELSSEPGYMDAFVAACFLPHTDSRLFPGVK